MSPLITGGIARPAGSVLPLIVARAKTGKTIIIAVEGDEKRQADEKLFQPV